MTPNLVLLALPIIMAAFIIGFAIRRASICAVLAAEQLVMHRRSSRMRSFLTAASWAGVMIVLLAWLFPGWAKVSPGFPLSLMVLAGGAVFGIGAYVNGACAFGTLAHLAGGDSDFAGTLVGIGIGAMAISALGTAHGIAQPSPLATPSMIGVLALALFLLIAVRFTWTHYQAQRRRVRELLWIGPWRPATAMVVIGLAGGFLHAMANEWTYMSVLSNRAAHLVDPTFPDPPLCALIGFVSLLVGGITAAAVSGKFHIAPIEWRAFGQKIVGGFLMSGSAALIPGGNDVMLIYGLPSLAPHAVAAYTAMTLTLFLLFWLKKRVLFATVKTAA